MQKFNVKLSPQITAVVDLIAFAVRTKKVNLWPYWKRTYRNRQSLNRARKQLLTRKLKYFRVKWSTLLRSAD